MSSIAYTYRQISAGDTYPIRQSVLWPDTPLEKQGLPADDEALHFGAFVDSTSFNSPLVSVVSVYPNDPYPFQVEQDLFEGRTIPSVHTHARIRKFATLHPYQRTGAGSGLLDYAKNEATKLQASAVNQSTTVDPSAEGRGHFCFFWLDAREVSVPWYTRRGWRRLGEPFEKYGGKRYCAMGCVQRRSAGSYAE
jgi:hypothetical protein